MESLLLSPLEKIGYLSQSVAFDYIYRKLKPYSAKHFQSSLKQLWTSGCPHFSLPPQLFLLMQALLQSHWRELGD